MNRRIATSQPARAARPGRGGLAVLALLGGCASTGGGAAPAQLTKEQIARCKQVAQAYVDQSPDYPAMRDELREQPAALEWLVRYYGFLLVKYREGRADVLPDTRMSATQANRAARRNRAVQAEWQLHPERHDLRLIHELGEIGEPAVPVFVDDFLVSPQTFLRQIGIDVLAEIGEPAVPKLLALARSGDNKQQAVAARALGDVGARGAAFEALKELSRSDDWRVRSNAAMGLHSGDEAARALLIAMLDDDDPFVRRKAAETLENYRDAVAAGALVDYLDRSKQREDFDGELQAQKSLQAIAGRRGPRSSEAWRGFVQRLAADEPR